jgi:hypothetical protein
MLGSYRAAFSFEYQEQRLFRHLSLSRPSRAWCRGGSVTMVAKALRKDIIQVSGVELTRRQKRKKPSASSLLLGRFARPSERIGRLIVSTAAAEKHQSHEPATY